ncbi:MAG: hypothetical protein M0R32_07470 [Candidatus Cloacimonetes bacterium]|jgi:hypothetical protein|nr:hypothetical protein [Candidatus Cloacimonadota bacterium]
MKINRVYLTGKKLAEYEPVMKPPAPITNSLYAVRQWQEKASGQRNALT